MKLLKRPAVLVFCLTLFCPAVEAQSVFTNFVTRAGGRLMDGARPLRFISFNIPNLHYIEDNMQFEQPDIFRLPTAFEVDDALTSIQLMGGQVVRIYTLSVRKTNDVLSVPRHLLGPGQWNEQAMVALDRVLETANRRGVRIIFPFVDNWPWWGGVGELAGFRGKSHDEFFTDPQVRKDYQQIVHTVLNRVNTLTGTRYKDDKAVLAWELGNELSAPKPWISEMAAYVKQQDPNHLVAESGFNVPDDPSVDIVQDHLYQGNPIAMLRLIDQHARMIEGKKVYWVGEFGFTTPAGMLAVLDDVVSNRVFSGAMMWCFRFHNQDGGFYWHIDHGNSGSFQSYYWPGFPILEPYDEARFMREVRRRAFEIQDLTPPAIAPPAAPELFSVTDGGLVNWRGSAGAANYDLQGATSVSGPWETVGWEIDDAQIQYHPLYNDESVEPAATYFYRLLARNEGGLSGSSKNLGPVTIRCRTLVDELWNLARVYRRGGKLELKTDDCRNYKEDCHRLWGTNGAWIAYHVPGPILGARVYAFGQNDKPELEILAGNDPDKAAKLAVRRNDFPAGNEMYKFRPPALLSTGPLPDKGSDVVIRFTAEAQISRVEIEYGK